MEGWVFDPRPLSESPVALLGQERSPQPPRQEANFRFQPAEVATVPKSTPPGFFAFIRPGSEAEVKNL